MTLLYNDIPYEVTAESIYCDFGIRVSTIEEACTIINDLADRNHGKNCHEAEERGD